MLFFSKILLCRRIIHIGLSAWLNVKRKRLSTLGGKYYLNAYCLLSTAKTPTIKKRLSHLSIPLSSNFQYLESNK